MPTANKTGKNTKFVSVSHAQYAHPFPPSGLMSVSFFGVSSQTLTRRDFFYQMTRTFALTSTNLVQHSSPANQTSGNLFTVGDWTKKWSQKGSLKRGNLKSIHLSIASLEDGKRRAFIFVRCPF